MVREEHLTANINQHIARLRVDSRRCRAEFLSEWLNCPAGLELSNRYVSGGTRAAQDHGAIRSLRLPLPPLEVQEVLIGAMDTARAGRRAKLAKADARLAGIDDLLLNALGIAPPVQGISRRDGRLLLNRVSRAARQGWSGLAAGISGRDAPQPPGAVANHPYVDGHTHPLTHTQFVIARSVATWRSR